MPDEEWNRILNALSNERYQWRTLDGIATEAELPVERVIALLDQHSRDIVRSSVPSATGRSLYTTRSKYNLIASPIAKFLSNTTFKILP